MPGIKIDYNRAREVARIAVSMKDSGLFPFGKPNLYPDVTIPTGMKQGDLDHRLFMYYSSSLDAGRDSYIAYDAMVRFALKVHMTDLPRLEQSELLSLMREPFARFGNPEKALGRPAETLYHNSGKMFREYDNDPNNMLAETPDKTIHYMMFGKNKADKFKTVGRGKAALIMKNFVRFKIWPFSEYEIPIKIDRHIISISVGSGVIKGPEGFEVGRTDKIARLLEDTYRKIGQENQISAVDMNDAFWIIGRHLCKINNSVSCRMGCGINCLTRPRLSERASYYHPQTERRKET